MWLRAGQEFSTRASLASNQPVSIGRVHFTLYSLSSILAGQSPHEQVLCPPGCSASPPVCFPDHTMCAPRAWILSRDRNRFPPVGGNVPVFSGEAFDVLEMVPEANFDLLTRSAKGSILPVSAGFLCVNQVILFFFFFSKLKRKP